MACPHKDRIMEELFPANVATNTSVWAILDGARDQRIFYKLRDSGLDYLCLYSGHLQRELQLAAPYIIELSQDGAFTRRLLEHAWGNNWGIFVSTKDGPNLRPHLRKFLRVRNEAGQMMLFRYYDPRVMREYLPTCMPDELKAVFGPIQRYLVEDKNPQTLIEFKFDGLRLGQRRIVLHGDERQ
jgi:hypothetical protein